MGGRVGAEEKAEGWWVSSEPSSGSDVRFDESMMLNVCFKFLNFWWMLFLNFSSLFLRFDAFELWRFPHDVLGKIMPFCFEAI